MEIILWILAFYLGVGAVFALMIRAWKLADMPTWVAVVSWPFFFNG